MANTKKVDCVILGLLSHESLTGYEIKRRIDSSLSLFWGASYGSIYPTLNTLVKDRMITGEDASQNGREKFLYTITDTGRQHLKDWLKLPVEKDELRYETLLKLFFGRDNGTEGTIRHIDAFQEKAQNNLEQLRVMEQILKKIEDMDETHLYYLLTVKFGVKTYEGYLEWCKEAKKELKRRIK